MLNSMPIVCLSVIVAARNEAKNIATLLNSIVSQTYQNFEIILVDDHSDDETVKIATSFLTSVNNLKIIELSQISNIEGGKKSAIEQGIRAAKGELIITTDADCAMHKNWLLHFASFYENEKPDLIVGAVFFDSLSFFEKLQSLEFVSLAASTAGAVGFGSPIMCNAANLAFRKSALQDIAKSLKYKYKSGDDMFLLEDFKRRKLKISYLKNLNSVVKTNALSSFSAFWAQRKRWASKSAGYSDGVTILFGLVVFFVNLIIVIGYSILPLTLEYLWLTGLILLIKSIPDFLLIFLAAKFFRKLQLLWLFIPLQLIYPVYVILVGIFGQFSTTKWKGRKL